MKFAIKLLAGLLGAVLTALLVLIAAVALFVDPNDYRDDIAGAVKAQTGRDLAIDGELSLGLFPCCAISLGETRLSNPPGFEQASFARVESARLGVQVFPLLTRQELLLDEVALVGLQVDLQRLDDGRANWEFGSGEASPETASESDKSGGGSGLSALSIGGIRVADARLSLRDQAAGTDILIDNLDLTTGTLEPGRPFEFDGSLHFIDGASDTEANLALTADATIDIDSARIELRGVDGSISGSGEEVGRFELALVAPAAAVDLSDELRADASDVALELKLTGGQLGNDGSVSVTAGTPELRFDGSLALSNPDLALDASTAALPGSTASGQLRMEQLSFDPDTGSVALRAVRGTLKLAGAAIDVTASGSLGSGTTRLRGDFELAELSPRELLASLGEPAPETADPSVLTQLAARGDWQLRDDSLALDGLAVQLDDSSLTGELSARNFDQPKVAFELVVDSLNLDRYLAPESEAAAEGRPAAPDDEQDPDLEGLRSLDIEGGLKVGSLTVTNLLIENLAARLTVRDGVIRLDPATASLYDGQYSGSVALDASGPDLRLELDQTLKGVQARGLLTDFAEVTQLEGVMVARIQASGSGRNQDELLRNLQGDLSFDLADGVYQGMDLWEEIRVARALIRRKAPPARTGKNQTVINTLTGKGRLADGVLRSQRMEAEIPFLRLTGDGALNVLAQELDYRFEAKVFETPTFPDGESYDDLNGLTIPVTISGPAEKPNIGVDLATLATNVAVQKATDKLFERLGIGKQEEQQDPAASGGEPADTGEQAAPGQSQEEQPPEQEEKKPRDILRESLRDLIRQ